MNAIRLCGVGFAFVVMKPMSLVMSLSLPLMSTFEVGERGIGVIVIVRRVSSLADDFAFVVAFRTRLVFEVWVFADDHVDSALCRDVSSLLIPPADIIPSFETRLPSNALEIPFQAE